MLVAEEIAIRGPTWTCRWCDCTQLCQFAETVSMQPHLPRHGRASDTKGGRAGMYWDGYHYHYTVTLWISTLLCRGQVSPFPGLWRE